MNDADRNNGQYLKNVAALPPYCYAMVDGKLVRINKGEAGVYPMNDNKGPITGDFAKDRAAILNRAMGISLAQQLAMVAGIAHGWESPLAHPEQYEQ